MMLFFGGIWMFILSDSGSLMKDRIILRTPIFGKLVLQNLLSKFSKTFGILVGSGVSIMDSMSLLE